MPKSVVPIATRLSESMASLLKDAANALKGESRRLFMAKTTKELGHGGQRLAERELGWCRETIRKAMRELNGGIVSVNAFNMRGRTKYVERLPRLVDDIRDIADQHVQIDATFRTEKTYLRLTAEQCLKELQEKGYSREELPSRRTMNDILNQLGLRLRTVVRIDRRKKCQRLTLSSSSFRS